jgi:hypothetical protein
MYGQLLYLACLFPTAKCVTVVSLTHLLCPCVCRSVEPELYPRPDGTVYACGEPQAAALPSQGPAGVTVDASRCDFIKVSEWTVHVFCAMIGCTIVSA